MNDFTQDPKLGFELTAVAHIAASRRESTAQHFSFSLIGTVISQYLEKCRNSSVILCFSVVQLAFLCCCCCCIIGRLIPDNATSSMTQDSIIGPAV